MINKYIVLQKQLAKENEDIVKLRERCKRLQESIEDSLKAMTEEIERPIVSK
jgi:flagellar motility protein MotE (MotC chaperone)